MSLDIATSLSPFVNITYTHEHQRYNIASTYGELEKIATAASASVKFVPDHDLLVARRGFGSRGGVADVIIGLDATGRIINIEIEFSE